MVNNKKKYVLDFTTENGSKYYFDGITGTIIPINNIMEDIVEMYPQYNTEEIKIKLMSKYPIEQIQSCISFIERWVKTYGGIFITNKEIQKNKYNMKYFNEITLKQFFDMGNQYQLIINITEDCNLRCKYCYLSEVYEFTRNRTSQKMTLETGKRAINMFLKKLDEISEFNPGKKGIITFYGGEPLLEYLNIKELIEYAKKTTTVPLTFNLTTNGTLLNEEIIDFIVENNIYVAVSLDGSMFNHDRNRVYSNNKGSYEKIISNIELFRRKYPNYNFLSLICVYDIKTDLIENDKFFENNDNMPPVTFVNGVSSINTNYFKQFSQEDYKKHFEQYSFLVNKYVDSKKNHIKISEYLRVLMEEQLCGLLIRSRHQDIRPPMLPYTNNCVPGMKISVRADGTYDMCERVNSTTPIGDINKGLNLTSIKNIIKDYNSSITEECDICPINKVCSLCFAQCNNDGCFKKYVDCEQIRNINRYNLSIIYSIMEVNPDAYENFEDSINIEWFFNN
ncbi:radical SAM protein [Herbinix luporum]|uniref:radical SAM protein n=1 Tax=Herbinix luporum TaxID=1679721 RepID=UPI001776F844|nr:radical SAM protein [Herbinix luporum]HHT57270.1 radical SAM protein [Herbinix luporum]